MSRALRRSALAAALLTLVGAVGSGCGLDLEDVPLPSLVDGPTYAITVEFADALNLPVDAPVKLDGATVGQVTDVRAGEYVAEVELALSEEVHLRATSHAEIRLTSPMGTAFVQLLPGRKGPLLAAGDVLPVDETSTAPDVTDLLSALSTVVTGGSFDDISTIIKQLNVALTGNAGDVRELLARLEDAVTGFNQDFPLIDRLTRSVGRLSARLAADAPDLAASLTDLTDLVATLDHQRTRLVAAMASLQRFDAVATPLTQAVRDDLLRQLGEMKPVLQTLLDGRGDVDGVMKGLIAFARGSDRASPGDYVNFDLTFLMDLQALLEVQNGDGPPVHPEIPRSGGTR